MAKRKPGFDEASGSRGRRVNRYAAAGDNDTDNRHKDVHGTTISFTAPDIISDSGSDFAKFRVGEFITVEGSAGQDGTYEIATVVAGQLDTVEQTITTEGGGAVMSVRSDNNRNVNRAA